MSFWCHALWHELIKFIVTGTMQLADHMILPVLQCLHEINNMVKTATRRRPRAVEAGVEEDEEDGRPPMRRPRGGPSALQRRLAELADEQARSRAQSQHAIPPSIPHVWTRGHASEHYLLEFGPKHYNKYNIIYAVNLSRQTFSKRKSALYTFQHSKTFWCSSIMNKRGVGYSLPAHVSEHHLNLKYTLMNQILQFCLLTVQLFLCF